jgi:hypothetical protein
MQNEDENAARVRNLHLVLTWSCLVLFSKSKGVIRADVIITIGKENITSNLFKGSMVVYGGNAFLV